MYKYRIYGLNVLSNLQLDCYPHEFEKEDLCVRFTRDEEEIDRFQRGFRSSDIHFVMVLHDKSGKICYDGVKNIIVYYKNEDDLKQSVFHYLMGTAFGFIFTPRKIFALHGSCVSYGDKATVFVGNSGAGKSSLAVGFAQYGGKIISDDISRLELDSEFPFIYPSFPAHKLWINTIEKLELGKSNASGIKGETGKYFIRAGNDNIFLNDKVPVIAIVHIRPTDMREICIIRENLGKSIQIILDNIFNNHINHYPELTECLYDFILSACEKIPVFTLYRPVNRFMVTEQVQLIMKDIYHEEENL